MFSIIKKDKKTKARLGILTTPHGIVKTPAYVFVGTYGKFRHLEAKDIKRTGTQLVIANTFHLWGKTDDLRLTTDNKKTFLTKSFGLKIPTMTDSGGFQVLSLAFDDKNKVGKFTPLEVAPPRSEGLATALRARLLTGFMTGDTKLDKNFKRTKIRITSKGVHFKYNDKNLFLGPELSMKLQKKIGADIIFAFDHITSPLDDYEYNKKAVELTDRWASRCLKLHLPLASRDGGTRGTTKGRQQTISALGRQQLFGIVQGGLFKDLRIKSAKSIGAMPFDGFGIGGSYTKKQIAKILKWVIPYLPEEKPRHLLGVGKVADVFEAIENGIDTFDCVIPTREARHGRLYTKTSHLDIRKGKYTNDKKVIEKGCGCLTCVSGISRQQIRKSLKDQPSHLVNEICNCRRQSLTRCEGQRWCLMHNMWFFNNFLNEIRASLVRGSYQRYKKSFLKKFGI
ncbi:MAG: tRNA guanosine(34) transglycosylase Tgt [Patescibacteria group bacterium]